MKVYYDKDADLSLVKGKKVTIIIASGSEYTSGSPMESYNVEGPYFRVILGFIGITDITIVHAGGTNKVAQGQVPEPVFLEQFIHQVDLAASK